MADQFNPLRAADWSGIPHERRVAIQAYILDGVVPLDDEFLIVILSNNLRSALDAHADTRTHAIITIVNFLTRYAPPLCWGSGEAIANWEYVGGMRGRHRWLHEYELAVARRQGLVLQ